MYFPPAPSGDTGAYGHLPNQSGAGYAYPSDEESYNHRGGDTTYVSACMRIFNAWLSLCGIAVST